MMQFDENRDYTRVIIIIIIIIVHVICDTVKPLQLKWILPNTLKNDVSD